jgi:hypothetical protein
MGGVVINEFAYYLDPAGDTGKEWVELYNPDSVPLDLSGCDLYPARSPHYLIPQGFVLGPCSYVVVHLRQGGANTATDLYEGTGPTNNMTNTKGSLALFADSTRDAILDFVQYGADSQTYEATAAYALIWTRGDYADTVSCGWSLGLAADGADSNRGTDWKGFSRPTPGYSNDPQPYDVALLSASSEPLEIPAGSGFTVSAWLQNQGIYTARNVTVTFFEDGNRDSICQAGEAVLYKEQWDSLAGLRASVFSLPGRTEGPYSLAVTAICDSETAVLNNYRAFDFNVGSPLVINEIMYGPPDGQPEWVELYNRSSWPVDICGWTLEDSTMAAKTVTARHDTVAPGMFVLLAKDTSWFHASCLKEAMADWPSLNNGGDAVCLRDQRGAVIDKVQYNDSWGGDDGRSLERINPLLISQDASGWGGCVDPSGGTPGLKNSIYIERATGGAELRANPNPFSPDGDGGEDWSMVSFDLAWSRALVSLKIFDRTGRPVRTLADRRESGASGSQIWDGRNDGGMVCPIGLYIVLLEAKDYYSSASVKKKLALALARRM